MFVYNTPHCGLMYTSNDYGSIKQDNSGIQGLKIIKISTSLAYHGYCKNKKTTLQVSKCPACNITCHGNRTCGLFALHVIFFTEMTVVHLCLQWNKNPMSLARIVLTSSPVSDLITCCAWMDWVFAIAWTKLYNVNKSILYFVLQFDSIWWFTLLCMCSMSFQRDIYDIIDNKILWHLSKTPCSPKILIHSESNCKLLIWFRILPFK